MTTHADRPLPRWSLLGLVLCIAIGAGRIIGTYEVFSETYDEGVHVAAGMELVDRGTFTYEPKHPPLSRVAVALGPYLSGVRSQGIPEIWAEGRAVIHSVNANRTLFLARLGILPFFVLAALVVWAWSRRLGGDGAALIGVALFTTAPPVLAHASVATTDMALLATLLALLFATVLWLESPTTLRSAALGVAGAAALTAKLSSVAFFGAALVLIVGLRWVFGEPGNPAMAGPRSRLLRRFTLGPPHLRQLLVVAPIAFLAMWSVYGFHVEGVGGIPVPLTSFARGVRDLVLHNDRGHASFLMGRTYADGDVWFFPVALAVKTPLTLLGLAGAGLVLMVQRSRAQRDWQVAVPVLAIVAILAVTVPSRINIGVRHVIPVFGLFAICAGVAGVWVWQRWSARAARGAMALAAVAGLWSTLRVHPDYLAYFNELAGPRPERILVDSDLDWGQDLHRLRDTLAARGIDSVTTAYFGSAVPELYGIPVRQRYKHGEPVQGWFVVSQTLRQRGDARLQRHGWEFRPDAYAWLDRLPVEARIGTSLLLYRVP